MGPTKRSSYKKDVRRLDKRKEREDGIRRQRHEMRYGPKTRRTRGWELGR
ncbi:MAG: hypothetical protein M3Q49_14695 [Actinomycetota bacterium]|nr:hypothetical protein [Actinomycetota bacterium]